MATTEKTTAWSEVERLKQRLAEAEDKVTALDGRRREATAAVTRAEGRLRDAYAASAPPAELRAARERLTRARAEAEPASWEGRRIAAQAAADAAGAAVEDHAREHFRDLAAENFGRGRGIGQREDAWWSEGLALSRERNAVEGDWAELGRLVGEDLVGLLPASPLDAPLRARPIAPDGWCDPVPVRPLPTVATPDEVVGRRKGKGVS